MSNISRREMLKKELAKRGLAKKVKIEKGEFGDASHEQRSPYFLQQNSPV